jgi:hypothetical protein
MLIDYNSYLVLQQKSTSVQIVGKMIKFAAEIRSDQNSIFLNTKWTNRERDNWFCCVLAEHIIKGDSSSHFVEFI